MDGLAVGVGQDILYSRAFTACTGVVLRNTTNGKAIFLHIIPDGFSSEQLGVLSGVEKKLFTWNWRRSYRSFGPEGH